MNYYDRKELETLINRVGLINKKVIRLEADVINIWKEINDLWSILIEILKDFELLKARVSDLEDRMDKAEKEIDQLFQEITFIWGDKDYRDNHATYNIKEIWLKIGELTDRITDIDNRLKTVEDTVKVLQDEDKKIITVGGYYEVVNYNGQTYPIRGGWVRIRDINDPDISIMIQATHNEAGSNEMYWPSEGIYLKFPHPFDHECLAITANDTALLKDNDIHPIGTAIGLENGTGRNTHYGIKTDTSSIAWGMIAIGY